MTRTATTKLVATALAVASLGLASTAQAEEAPATATGGTPPVVEQAPAPAPATPATEEAPATEPSQEELDKQRYERYCHMKDAEPSHNDKKFCEDNKGRFEPGSTTNTTGHGNYETTSTRTASTRSPRTRSRATRSRSTRPRRRWARSCPSPASRSGSSA